VELLCAGHGRGTRRRCRVRRLLGCWADVGGRGGWGAIDRAVSVARCRLVFVLFRRRGVAQEKGRSMRVSSQSYVACKHFLEPEWKQRSIIVRSRRKHILSFISHVILSNNPPPHHCSNNTLQTSFHTHPSCIRCCQLSICQRQPQHLYAGGCDCRTSEAADCHAKVCFGDQISYRHPATACMRTVAE
jgi:hypothetical protein